MDEITSKQVKEAIEGFLSQQLQKKLEPEQKRFEKAQNDNDELGVQDAAEKIAALQQRFEPGAWLENAASKMAGELKFGTHIAKGVHPDAKGDNVNFRNAASLPPGIVGSQVLESLELDANGNAASLPLASFFNVELNNDKHMKLRDLILQEHPALLDSLSENIEVSQRYVDSFKAALTGENETPSADERNKQILWPASPNAIAEDHYITLLPLHPSALTSVFFQKLNGLRYSDENKAARENRKKITAVQHAYVSISDLAVKRLGGTKPQNVSQLTSSQGGRGYLLQSIPPKSAKQSEFVISRTQSSFFTNKLRSRCWLGLRELCAVVEKTKNIAETRDQRKYALEIILGEVLSVAATIQQSYAPGWSREYDLEMAEKYWLDPNRALLEGEDAFKAQREKMEWVVQIEQNFALWINAYLKERFKKLQYEFDDSEHYEWLREIGKARSASQRAGEGVFA